MSDRRVNISPEVAQFRGKQLTQRKAGDAAFIQSLLNEIKPWSAIPGNNTWNNQTEAQFVQNDRNIVSQIIRASQDGQSDDEIADWLVSQYGFNRQEGLNSTLGVLDKGDNYTRQVLMGVPNAAADEYVTTLLLNANRTGDDIIVPNNLGTDNPMFATDLRTKGGTMIDAQTRGMHGLNVGILNNVSPGIERRALQNIRERIDPTLLDYVSEIRGLTRKSNNNYHGAREDKLLHDVNTPMLDTSDWFEDNKEFVHKDAIGSTRTERPRNNGVFKPRHGKYNPTTPQGIAYIPLEKVRSTVLNMPVEQLMRGVETQGQRVQLIRGTSDRGDVKLGLGLNNAVIDAISGKSEMIDPRVVEYFSRPTRSQPRRRRR